jgi:hypothetical protein
MRYIDRPTDTGSPFAVVPGLAVATIASIGAGAIHAAAIGVHSEHKQAVVAFTIVATVQIGWGVLALVFRKRLLVLAGIAANAACLAGWVLAKTSSSGISFIDGLDSKEAVQAADALAAGLAAVAVLAGTVALIGGLHPRNLGHSTFGIAALVTTLAVVPGMVGAGSHNHAHGVAGHTHATDPSGVAADGHVHDAATGGSSGGSGHTHPAAVVPPKPYDPTKPIDLGGVAGVTPEQQARAENIIAMTVMRLPQWADYHTAEKAGFFSIGDAVTGDEHFINMQNVESPDTLDPDHPESLVYEPDGNGGKKLAAAMYMLPPGKTLAEVPNLGGKLMQWHIHNNLCFSSTGQVAGIRANGGACAAGLNGGIESPMIHVWIRPNPCGPFAALEGIGGGQIAAGETRLCDTAHGSH